MLYLYYNQLTLCVKDDEGLSNQCFLNIVFFIITRNSKCWDTGNYLLDLLVQYNNHTAVWRQLNSKSKNWNTAKAYKTLHLYAEYTWQHQWNLILHTENNTFKLRYCLIIAHAKRFPSTLKTFFPVCDLDTSTNFKYGPKVLCQDEALVWMLLRHSLDAQLEGSNEKRCTVSYCVSGTKNGLCMCEESSNLFSSHFWEISEPSQRSEESRLSNLFSLLKTKETNSWYRIS